MPISPADRKELAQVKTLLDGESVLTGSEACNLFMTMSEIGGATAGTEVMVSFQPVNDSTASASGQTCSDGTFTSVVYLREGLEKSPAVEKAVVEALHHAHTRSLALESE